MKKIINIVLVIALLVSIGIPARAREVSNSVSHSSSEEKLLNYLQGDNDKLLLLRCNYGYMTFVENFRSSVPSLYLIGMIDKLIGTGAEPDKEKYMEILINIIAAYDLDNATDISEQKKMDNLKDAKDYAMDCAEMGAKAISIMVGSNSAASELESSISTAVDGLTVLMDNTDNWIEGLSNLETIIQDYSNYDMFLEVIEDNSDGNLKEAAKTLRSGMTETIKIKLDTYNEILIENFENYQEFIFSDIFFDAVKHMPEYESDDTLKFFVDAGDDLLSKSNILKDSWELGELIGTWIGDVVVGGEDLINRVLEMMALYDISMILQTEILDIGNQFLTSYGERTETKIVDDYVLFSQYLIGCRIRGEYCLYSMVANDAGLLSWFNKDSAKEAEAWYESKAEKVLDIQNDLLKILEEDVLLEDNVYTWIVEPIVEADDIYYLADYPGVEHSLNELSKQANNSNAVIQRGSELGIIDINGNLLTEVAYKEIANFGDKYMMVRTLPEYLEDYNTDWDVYWLDKEGKIEADVGNGDLILTVYYYYEGNRQRAGDAGSEYVQDVIPVQEVSEYVDPYALKTLLEVLSGKYALERSGNLITDFIYDECGSLSNGLIAICQNGKWGYVDENGEIVIPIEYDASWKQYPVFDMGSKRSSSNVKDYCYAASGGYVVLRQGEEWELRNIQGKEVIPKGDFEEIRPVFDEKCWVKKDGKWGVIQIDCSEDKTGGFISWIDADLEDRVMDWRDEGLKKAMQEYTGITDRDIMLSDVWEYTELNLAGPGIGAEGEEKEKLYIENIDALGILTNLTILDISSNDIKDIGVLGNLINLTELNLYGNPIRDISALSYLTNLRKLTLAYCTNDIRPLSNLTSLQDLSLRYNNISDLSPLSGLINLVELDLDTNNINDLSPLSDLKNLEVLILWRNEVNDLSPLANLTNLRILWLDENDISDISALSHLTSLVDLGLSYNHINDINVLGNLTNLTDLSLDGNNITDYSVLDNLTNAEIRY